MSTPHDTASQADADTCRICRGEGTPEEPLFYPCKCSGSIKYVHQDCLMEWLSHSQKKHCELCKTPFRFTKLYAHNMPKTVPAHVFVSHITKYIFRNILVWLRAGLVLMVWLVWLPYLMRRVWSALFWLSDEGLGPVWGRSETTSTLTSLVGAASGATTCPASPLFVETTSAAALQSVMSQAPSTSATPTTTSLYGINITTDNPLGNVLLNAFLGSFYMGGGSAVRNDISAAEWQQAPPPPPVQHSSLLSDTKFLQKLYASSPALGGFAIDVIEGQIITIIVIVCFILIILVRDYVVQQQPDINMRAAFAAAGNPVPAEEAVPAQAPAEDDQLGPFPALDQEDDEASTQAVDENAEEPRDYWTSAADDVLDDAEVRHRRTFENEADRSANFVLDTAQSAASRQPASPGRSIRGPAENYMRIYRQAMGDPDEFHRIAREENLEDELALFLGIEGSSTSRPRPGPSSAAANEAASSDSEQSRRGSDWNWPRDTTEESRSKGKSPAPNSPLDSAAADHDHSSRSRSATDGPQVFGGVNPLAHNSWAFAEDSRHNQRSSPSDATRRGPVAEPSTSTARWDYMTPPSSTLAESPSSSVEARTPSSSGSNNSANDSAMNPQDDTAEAVVEAHRAGDWETLSESDMPLEEDRQTDTAVEEMRAPEPPQPAGFTQLVADFMWRDVDAIPRDELAPFPDAGDEFFDHEQEDALAIAENPLQPQEQEQDQEVVAAAAAAGIDAEAEAMDDAEDIEGILELLGMRGPIAGLFQNALFCAFLVSITLFIGVFVPYNLGRLAIWIVAHPNRPLRMVFSLSSFVQDLGMLVGGLASTLIFGALNGVVSFFRPQASQLVMTRSLMQGSWTLMENAGGRLRDSGIVDLTFCSADELRNFSIVSHAALLTLKSQVANVFAAIGYCLSFVFGGHYVAKFALLMSQSLEALTLVWQTLKHLPSFLTTPGSWVIDFGASESVESLSPELASWGAMDRFWAILGGYTTLCVSAAIYLGRGTPFAGRLGQDWEATVIDVLVQASGVMKVILIIGIEMLIFPLYCGLLLDVALLPLFENTSIMSRAMFTINYPFTSIFVHWFVGTGYMFHFALFVSMCRKIMRKGVLYFIRDPDDAEFHPVRDVLERNVTTQLRKILFSAFVYGALVIVCLGGVVWALSYGFKNVLPIYYSSNEPVLEFPIDLLFYNFLMPLAVKFFRPSDGLHSMYTWWFRRLARTLRLTWFLFGERRVEEEGSLTPVSEDPAQTPPFWKKLAVKIHRQAPVPASKLGALEGEPGSTRTFPSEPSRRLDARKKHLVESGQLTPNGRFVRAPASDQVKIPKGQRVFLNVSEHNQRQDGKSDELDADLYSSSTYTFVYVPPNFRFRIFLFILFIWLFAATTGVGFTIIPLMFGRAIFRFFIPSDVRTNDIYAFSIGLYILGSVLYFICQIRDIYSKATTWLHDTATTLLDRDTIQRAIAVSTRAAKLVYSYFFLLVVFPFMVSSLMELYLLIPLDTYMYGSATASTDADATVMPRHTVRVMQSWTIGIIYLKLAARFVVHWHRDSRLAAAIRAVLRHGWLEPDVKVLTRAFVVPGLTLWLVAVFGPLMLAKSVLRYMASAPGETAPSTEAGVVLVYRFCFAVALLSAVLVAIVNSIFAVLMSWRVRIKDEAYLIGERLHNFSSPQQALRDKERESRQTRVGWE
ncbi:hypothetical protein BD289DRAFT_458271 [Coniella lustricola]|uniref:RING-type E3 ubiquitin transferase n=1 Tax=Coniella lustricola TaxID=2025994 RepID=A0A2T3AK54_9PEZI|nr:hypothetical protein BD289DRAFT_458271 [Coniella lustricola]